MRDLQYYSLSNVKLRVFQVIIVKRAHPSPGKPSDALNSVFRASCELELPFWCRERLSSGPLPPKARFPTNSVCFLCMSHPERMILRTQEQSRRFPKVITTRNQNIRGDMTSFSPIIRPRDERDAVSIRDPRLESRVYRIRVAVRKLNNTSLSKSQINATCTN